MLPRAIQSIVFIFKIKIMAKLINGIWGAISGKLGNLVAITRKGVTYLRTLAKPNNKPPSAKQIAQRAQFKFVHQFLFPFTPWITVGFHNPESVRTPLNSALSLNYGRIVKGSYPSFDVDYPAL